MVPSFISLSGKLLFEDERKQFRFRCRRSSLELEMKGLHRSEVVSISRNEDRGESAQAREKMAGVRNRSTLSASFASRASERWFGALLISTKKSGFSRLTCLSARLVSSSRVLPIRRKFGSSGLAEQRLRKPRDTLLLGPRERVHLDMRHAGKKIRQRRTHHEDANRTGRQLG